MIGRKNSSVLTSFFGFLSVALATPAEADPIAMRNLTKAMVLEARDYYETVSLEEATAAFNDVTSERWLREPFHLHLFGMNANGDVWADNVFTALVGTNFIHFADFDGKPFGKMIAENTPQDGSVYQIDIRFTSPGTGEIVPGVGSCLRPDADNILCSWSEE
ncbi:MAG: hypothetical protein ACRBM6_27380 [Geminicoccales bacterium]